MENPPNSAAGEVWQLVDHLFRHRAGQVVATLTRIFGPDHLNLAEDVVQDAMIKALREWAYHGVPESPDAWIMRVAKNGALDALRRDRSLRSRRREIAAALERQSNLGIASDAVLDSELHDDQLRMIFTCCHPAISYDARVALTLKTVGGFGVPEIARAFIVHETTVAQRLVRARRAIKRGHVPFEVPKAAELPARLDSVLSVLYGLFNEGYGAHAGEDLIRYELCAEAMRLTAILADHPAGDAPRVRALLALMLLHASRFPTRTDERGNLLLLGNQDRSAWDHTMISAGIRELARSGVGDDLSEYHLEAGIAACHTLAPSYEETDWPRILASYDALLGMHHNPVVALNRTVALAMVRGPEAGLSELERVRLFPGMETYHLFHATRAELLRRSGDPQQARGAYRQAADMTENSAERRFLERRREEC